MFLFFHHHSCKKLQTNSELYLFTLVQAEVGEGKTGLKYRSNNCVLKYNIWYFTMYTKFFTLVKT